MTLLCRWHRIDGRGTAYVLQDDGMTVEAALTRYMYEPRSEAAKSWTMDRSWIVPDGFGRTTRDAMDRCGVMQ